MAASPPTKPPRGVKQGKETSGLLMSVIRTLSASETNEQREKERAKLEKEYKKSDARLDELVAIHASEIMNVMQKFTLATNALSAWSQHCDAAVARLSTCQNLLQLRRDDLKRLWTDSRTHHYALQMLTDIERVVTSEREVRDAISSGRLLAAATLLRDALHTAQELAHVDALNHTRQHLENKKNELVDLLVKGLSSAVYSAEFSTIFRMDPLFRRASARKRAAILLAELTKTEEVTDAYLQDITPEFEASLIEEDKTFETTAMISLEALGVLGQLKEATEKFKVEIQHELLEVIEVTSKRVLEDGDFDVEIGEQGEQDADSLPEGVSETGRPLAKLLYCLTDDFITIAHRNSRLIQLWRAALHKHRITESCLYTEQHYWSAVQQVMQLLLTEYLEIESVTLAAQRNNMNLRLTTETTQTPKLADYFTKKKVTRPREKLFKFPVSTSVHTELSERRGTGGTGGPLVCRPSCTLLYAALPALHSLARHIDSLHNNGAAECSLSAFMSDYVRCGEATRLAGEARSAVDRAAKTDNAFTNCSHTDSSILVSTAEWWRVVRGVASLARRCGRCGGSDAARALLAGLAAAAQHASSRRAVHAPARAARWLRDDDIVRFLQSLPNWKMATDNSGDSKPSQQELEQAYLREAENLGLNLGDGVVSKNEIVTDLTALVNVALFLNSMEWFAANVRTLPAMLTAGGAVKLTDKFVSDLGAAADIFTELAHKSLLYLHLELRMQCFHYLCEQSQAEGASRLAASLQAFHQQALHILSPRALHYIVYGLGEVMSAATVCVGAGGGVSAAAGGGGALARLRNCLTSLGAPHAGLHAAQARLALLDRTPQEIIQSIKEKGPQFSELEYLNIFKEIGIKQGISQVEMKMYLKQLSSALGHVGVTV